MDEVKVKANNDSLQTASTSKTSPAPVYHRKRGRPKKGTYVPRYSSSDVLHYNDNCKGQKSSGKKKIKRKYDSVVDDDSSNLDYDVATDQRSSVENSNKRRRQPKVLDDYVTDFDTSDEESEKYGDSSHLQLSKQRAGVSKGQNRKLGEVNSLETDDILSYLSNFDKNFADQDIFGPDFLEDDDGSKVDSSCEISKDTLVGDTTSDGKIPEASPLTSEKQDSDMKNEESATFTSRQKEREWKQTVRNHRQQVAALQNKYHQLVQKIQNKPQKKPQFTKVLDLLYSASKLLNEEQLLFFTLQLKSNSKNLQGVRFSTREKVLALAIYAHRPETYRWLQSIFFLPSKLILDRWLEMIAKEDPNTAKRLMYYIYKKYLFHSE